MDIKEYVKVAYNNAKAKGWHEEPRSIGDFICLMHSELSEALEEHRNGRYPTEVYYNDNKPTKPEGIGIELADCVIRIFDFCGKYDIDLEELIEIKMKYNETRPKRHGGKII